ncbi:MAG TPA: polysaccharide biosynthesis/export family protein [Kiritimatiellia bacterium]|nr:polysaccharide biosynthesis/export family protein [Kiritimatiellia bacterium]HRZ12345.1 polysaccharide biosynthesis/export family protein [Kiritimatiellia bacterium]HSA17897.1 polysaccharide biosynthesis/export family protein [Kiritimatiellia bacterium]
MLQAGKEWRTRSLVLALAGGVLLAMATGCASRRAAKAARAVKPPPAAPAPAHSTALPKPNGAEQATLRPGLMVNVTVIVAGKKQIEEAGRRVSETSTLTLPLLGSLAVGGETLDSLTARLTAEYREYYVDPQVMVEFVRDDQPESISPWGSITVLGRVKRPGRVSIPPTRDLTVSVAIQQAGGFDTSAKDTAILVTRRAPDGHTTTRHINLREVGVRGRVENDIVLLPDDVVYVPELVF